MKKNNWIRFLFVYAVCTILPLSALIYTTEEIILVAISAVSFGLIHQVLKKQYIEKSMQNILLIFLAIVAIFIFANNLYWSILISAFFVLGILLSFIKLLSQPKFILGFLIAIFLFGSSLSRNTITRLVGYEPQDEQYTNDSYLFLKTVYLMQKGQSYYTAFDNAVIAFPAHNEKPSNISAYRLPTIFYLWKFLPNPGLFIWIGFLMLCSATLIASFKIAAKFSKFPLSILAPYLLVPYLLFSAKSIWFLMIEWWSAFFIVFFICLFLYKKERLAYFTLLLALLIRELAIIPIALNSIAMLFIKRKYFIYFSSLILIFVAFYGLHTYLSQTGSTSINETTSQLLTFRGIPFIKRTLDFGSDFYFFNQAKIPVLGIFLILSSAGSLTTLIKNQKERYLILISILFFAGFAFSFLFISKSIFNEYWGIMYVPVMISIIPWGIESFYQITFKSIKH